jgi:hypothetical protein
MKKVLLFLFSVIASLPIVLAQGMDEEICATMPKNAIQLASDPVFRQKQAEIEAAYQKYLRDGLAGSRLEEVYTIPVVVHVIHLGEAIGSGTNISDAQIQSAIDNLNVAYSNGSPYTGVNTNIQFVLAKTAPDCSATTGILRVNGSGTSNYGTDGITDANQTTIKALSKWPNDLYYNIWIVSEIDNNGGGSGVQGYAYFPGAGPSEDGTVILYNAFGYDPSGANGYNLKSYTNLNATAIHELGHAFSLYHTFQGDSGPTGAGSSQCPDQADGCTLWNGSAWEYHGDCVSDTPPHIRSASNCNTSGTNSCDGGSSNALFVHNFMDYSSGACKTKFTDGQKIRMRAAILASRFSLTTSPGGQAPNPVVFSTPIAPSCTPTTGSTGLSGYYCGIKSLSLNGVNNTSGYPSQDNPATGFLDLTASCIRAYEVTENNTYTVNVNVLYTNSQAVKVYIDYDNNGIFSETTERILSQTGRTSSNPASATFTVPTTAVKNTYLRMRVIDDIGSVTDACDDPTYGQAEDYLIFIKPCMPTTIPTSGGPYAATNECTDATGWTHYWNDPNPAVGGDELLLLSLKKNGNDIGTVGDGTFTLTLGGASPGATQLSAPTASYVVNSSPWWVMNRYWTLTPTTEPTTDVNVRFYYNTADYNAIIAQDGSTTQHQDMYFWKINDITPSFDPNPANGHAGVTMASAYNTDGYWQYVEGATPSTASWVYTPNALGNASYHQAEYVVGHFGGGGAGGGAGGGGALPTELLNLTGSFNGKEVLLAWKTASERDNKGFEVERSLDGRGFSKIGFVKGQGSSSERHDYAFTDPEILQRTQYYRLKQVDNAGGFDYSKVVAVETSKRRAFASAQPNPFGSGGIRVTLGDSFSGSFRAVLLDMTGRQVWSADLNGKAGELVDLAVPSELAKGAYLLRLATDGGEEQSFKLVRN